MAYYTRYKCEFDNEKDEHVVILIQGKTAGSVEALSCVDCQISCNGDTSELLTDNIITRTLQFSIHVPISSGITYDTFLVSYADEWQVIATVDGDYVFHGFMVPDESPIPMQDKPWTITLNATDGLKLLSKTLLSKIDLTEFNDKHSFIEYISGILAKTYLQLNVKVYCNIYYNPMATRAADLKNDMFSQAYIDYRSFMTSPTQFVDCYTALSILFKDHFRLYYDNGQWVIFRIPEFQYLPEGNRYYTIYNYSGTALSGGIDTSDHIKVGYKNLTRPINETQIVSGKYANKIVKHHFNYTVWDELPRNNKFERADIDPFISTSLIKYYKLRDWTYGLASSGSILPTLSGTTTKNAWRVSTYNAFGVETDRELQLQPDSSLVCLQSTSIPVSKNDKVSISFQVKLSAGGSGPVTYPAVQVYIKSPSTSGVYFLELASTITNPGTWTLSSASKYINANFSSSDPLGTYFSVSCDSSAIPADGDLYINFQANSLGGSLIYFKDFNFTYTPYVAGGYIPVTGDYWTRSQNNNWADTIDDELQISDSGFGAVKGTLWYGSGAVKSKTVTDWWRYGLGGSEIRHYKELVNLGFYNLTYRRFWKIDGDFDGTKVQVNSSGATPPANFTNKYVFEDLPNYKEFALVCPLKIDLVLGRFNATFQEVYASGADGTQNGDSAMFNYLFK